MKWYAMQPGKLHFYAMCCPICYHMRCGAVLCHALHGIGRYAMPCYVSSAMLDRAMIHYAALNEHSSASARPGLDRAVVPASVPEDWASGRGRAGRESRRAQPWRQGQHLEGGVRLEEEEGEEEEEEEDE
eukprot:8220037-Pyramimonas_sp.AAC.1